MTRLAEACEALHLKGTIELEGRWLTFQIHGCTSYVVEALWGNGYFTWCDHPHTRAVQHYSDPDEAIAASIQRIAQELYQQ